MTASTTLWDIKDFMYAQMNDTSNNQTYTSNNRDTDKINDVIRRVCSWFFRSALNPETTYKCGDFPFLRKKQYFEYVDSVACTAAVSVGDTTINLPNSTLSDAWAIYTQGIVMEYTGKSSTTAITWVTWCIANFESGTRFEQVFALNTDLHEAYRVFRLYDGKEMEVFEIDSQDDRYEREKTQAFTILYDETSGKKFIRFYGVDDGYRFIIKYYASVTDLVNTTDVCVIPDEYAKTVVAPIAWWELLMETQAEDAEYVNKLTLWYGKLEEMYHHYTKMIKDMDKMARLKPYDWRTIWWWLGVNDRYTRKWFRVY